MQFVISTPHFLMRCRPKAFALSTGRQNREADAVFFWLKQDALRLDTNKFEFSELALRKFLRRSLWKSD